MQRKVYTAQEMVSMDKYEFESFRICVDARAFRLLGMNWKKWIRVTQDHFGSLVFEWE